MYNTEINFNVEDVDFERLLKVIDERIKGLASEEQIRHVIIRDVLRHHPDLLSMSLQDPYVTKAIDALLDVGILGEVAGRKYCKLWKQKNKIRPLVYEGYITVVGRKEFTAEFERKDQMLAADFDKKEIIPDQRKFIDVGMPIKWYVTSKGCALRLVIKKYMPSDIKRAEMLAKEIEENGWFTKEDG